MCQRFPQNSKQHCAIWHRAEESSRAKHSIKTKLPSACLVIKQNFELTSLNRTVTHSTTQLSLRLVCNFTVSQFHITSQQSPGGFQWLSSQDDGLNVVSPHTKWKMSSGFCSINGIIIHPLDHHCGFLKEYSLFIHLYSLSIHLLFLVMLYQTVSARMDQWSDHSHVIQSVFNDALKSCEHLGVIYCTEQSGMNGELLLHPVCQR